MRHSHILSHSLSIDISFIYHLYTTYMHLYAICQPSFSHLYAILPFMPLIRHSLTFHPSLSALRHMDITRSWGKSRPVGIFSRSEMMFLNSLWANGTERRRWSVKTCRWLGRLNMAFWWCEVHEFYGYLMVCDVWCMYNIYMYIYIKYIYICIYIYIPITSSMGNWQLMVYGRLWYGSTYVWFGLDTNS